MVLEQKAKNIAIFEGDTPSQMRSLKGKNNFESHCSAYLPISKGNILALKRNENRPANLLTSQDWL